MSTLRRLLGATTLAAAALAVAGTGPAPAAPSGPARLSPTTQQARWDGGTFDLPAAAGCTGPHDPACDHLALEVEASAGQLVRVGIVDSRADNFDLFVFSADGRELGRSTRLTDAPDVVTFTHEVAGRAEYEVRVRPTVVTQRSSYRGQAAFVEEGTGGSPVDAEPQDCTEAVPEATGVAGVTDGGQVVNLDVYVLLDGVTTARGQEIMTRAADAYRPLNISLNVSGYASVAFSGTEAQGLIDQAKRVYGGSVPAGGDAVLVITGKDVTLSGAGVITGYADCYGGVRYANRSFAVSESGTLLEDFHFPPPDGPVMLYHRAAAKLAAHEIGHLMGAHHHYSNCVEGIPSELEVLEPSPCTLMFNSVDLSSINFGFLEGAVVRGHAVAYAQ